MDCDTWPVPEEGCYGGCDITGDEPLLAAAAAQAGIILTTLSGGRAGTCTDTIRPLSECPKCRGHCCCGGDRIHVASPAGPVTSVTAVKVDGVELDDADWRFYPSTQLLYRVAPDVWPNRDLKYADCDSVDTMCVDVVIGFPPDAWALAVHAELTCELLKSCTDQKCRIPRNATNVTGQGITVTLSPTELKQFIPSVAGWVAGINPQNAVSPPKVFSPDIDGGSGCGC